MTQDEKMQIGRLIEAVETLKSEVTALRADMLLLRDANSTQRGAIGVLAGLSSVLGGVAGAAVTWFTKGVP